MPWFKIDDSAYSHPKFRGAGNAALGLWLRCGAYSAQHLLEGVVPGVIARDFGTAAQAAKLVKVGLWHTAGHDCTRCPQPTDGSYVMHDFFEGGRNSTRAQVEASRKAATERQAKARAAAAAAAAGPSGGENRGANKPQSKSDRDADKVQTIPDRDSGETRLQDSAADQDALSQRDGLEGVTASHATPCHTAALPDGSAAGLQEPAPYDTLRDLKRACSAAGLQAVAWDLTHSQIERARRVMTEVGVPAMVDHAVSSVRRFGTLPRGASAWLRGWESLEAAPSGSGLPALAGSNVVALPLAGTDANLAGHAAVIAQLQASEQNR